MRAPAPGGWGVQQTTNCYWVSCCIFSYHQHSTAKMHSQIYLLLSIIYCNYDVANGVVLWLTIIHLTYANNGHRAAEYLYRFWTIYLSTCYLYERIVESRIHNVDILPYLILVWRVDLKSDICWRAVWEFLSQITRWFCKNICRKHFKLDILS